ncbi:hypothetical protein SCUCBS95973_008796 [Sporothrix curviconia]|uniref:Transcription factor domain-containing protein n=1 Tax=Sporothrix curviconia TaxID=1260050 RepID=A0ABP0CSS6_9PEZI
MLGLHRPDTYVAMSDDDRELRLRVYWVLFVSERAYCVQHGLLPILQLIRERPAPDHVPSSDHLLVGNNRDAGVSSNDNDVVKASSSASIASFLDLACLFTFLDGDLIEPPSAITPSLPGLVEDDEKDRQNRRRVTLIQSDLDPAPTEQQDSAVGLDETQSVDIFVTRSWIRILLWEYSANRSAPMATECGSRSGDAGRSMLFGSRDTLHGLERLLTTVGGTSSVFLDRLHNRMAEVQLPVVATAPSAPPMLQWPSDNELVDNTSTTEERASVEDISDLPDLLQLSPPETCMGLMDFDDVMAMDLSILEYSTLSGFAGN